MTKTDLPERLDLRSHDIAADKIAELLELFPEARTEDGQIDFDQLRRALGETVDPGKERYGLTWPGKAACFQAIQTPSLGTLLPAPEESVNWDTTENLIIEGDNLEVLKLLQKAYLGKVKMIYIDPPYNTGNDFIYPDDYAESLKTYLEYTGQVDAEGRRFSTNTDTEGRFHSKWLSMMYPRLYLARNLLRDDGVIFISIDDHEVRSLRALCDDIFGEENFLATVIWQKSYSPQMDAEGFSATHDYVVVFGRAAEARRLREPFEQDLSQFGFIDRNTGRHYRRRSLRKEGSNSLRSDAPGSWFPLTAPDGTQVWPYKPLKQGKLDRVEGVWRWSLPTYEDRLAQGSVEWVETADEGWQPFAKQFADSEAVRPPTTIWLHPEAGHTHAAAEEVTQMLGPRVFDTPKPTKLIGKMLGIATDTRDHNLVLDFFAGSGSVAHAVLDLNAQDNGNRRFILVQLPEPTDRDDYPTIADITKERVRRVITKLNESGEGEGQDRGFRVFKLAESNFSVWDAQGSHQVGAFEEQLRLHVDNVRDDRSAEDVLFELLLKSGYPPSATIEAHTIDDKQVFSVANGALLVCLDRGLTLELMREVAQRKPERFVVLDEGFAGNDQLKANAVQIFQAADVTFRTV
jgi:adenine-specific DNA-methyltransferase